MLRYKTEIRPGLAALYDIRPGNRARQFLQPWSPHGAPSGHLPTLSLTTTGSCRRVAKPLIIHLTLVS